MTIAFVTRYAGDKKELILTGDTMIRQLYELAEDMVYHDVHEYNNLGDECRVPPDYAEACMLVDNLRIVTQKFQKITDKISRWGYQKYYAQSYKEGSTLREIDGFGLEDWESEYQEKAHRCKDKIQEKFDTLMDTIKNLEPSDLHDSVSRFDQSYRACDGRWEYESTKVVIVKGFDDFGIEDNRTRYKDMTLKEMHDAQEQAYWDSLSDAQKQKEEEYAEPDITYMRENGYTSFACNDNGTISYRR